MSIDFEKMKKAMDEFNNSDEGKKYFQNIILKRETNERQIDLFHSKYGDKLDLVIEKLTEKYYSKKYRDREYDKRKVEPREKLLWFLFDYAEKYCKPCKNKKYFNPFTGGAYYVGSYVLQIMNGQGAALRIDKRK